MTFDLRPDLIWPEMALLALAVLVILVDMFIRPMQRGRLLGVAAVGLAVIGLAMAFIPRSDGVALHGQYIADDFSHVLKIFLVGVILTVILVTRTARERLDSLLGEHITLVLLSGLGMLVLASANDLVVLFLALELATIPLMILTALTRSEPESNEAAVKFLIAGAVASAFTIFGIALIWGFSGGTMNLTELRQVVAAGEVPTAMTVGLILLFAGLGFKTAIAPFHVWVPDVYEGAPTPITAFLAGGSKAAGFAALVRVGVSTFTPSPEAAFDWPVALAVLAGITALVGNLAAMWQSNIKRLLAHASVGHAGFLLMGLAVLGTEARAFGLTALIYYLVFYAVAVASVFFVIGMVSRAGGGETLTDYEGLARRSPGVAAGLLIGIFSMGGIPPLAGFTGKIFIVAATVQGHLIWLAIIAAICIVLSIVYTLMILRAVYVAPSRDGYPTVSMNPWEGAALLGLSLMLLVFGAYPAPILSAIRPAVEKLIG
jgi:NADH-quinone oxidoreductase subunit N